MEENTYKGMSYTPLFIRRLRDQLRKLKIYVDENGNFRHNATTDIQKRAVQVVKDKIDEVRKKWKVS